MTGPQWPSARLHERTRAVLDRSAMSVPELRRSNYKAVTLVVGVLLGLVPLQSADASTVTVRPVPVSSPLLAPDATTLVQQRLHDFGYTIKVDGIYGRQTTRVVGAWQRANRLDPNDVPALLASLSLPATASAPAHRQATPAPQPAPSGDVESIIRDVWPDELEQHAVDIATRESRLQPQVINANGNATGLFQIMWTVHRSWMCPQLGVCAQSQLQDARTNAEAALALYQRDGGWGPWKL